MIDASQNTCTRCGSPRSDDAAGGLCPRCLMAMNFESRTMPEGEASPKTDPPSVEEMRERFPQFDGLECLGRGGMGVVYKARQKALDRMVAIKVIAGERRADPAFAERFEREARTLAKMSHPHIVTVHDFGETGGLFYLVMEYVDGVNLRDLLREGRMAPEQALAIVSPVCDALQYAHDKGVVHRDIKPENLLLDRDGRVKVADFGLASLIGAQNETAGTPPYMAPEQREGKADQRADIYALGVVLYEMLTGERPPKEIVAPSKKVQIDVRIDEMVLRALEKEPERRYQTADEFRTVVETIAGTPPVASETPRVSASDAGEKAAKARGLIEGPAIAMAVVSGINLLTVTFGVLVLGVVALLVEKIPISHWGAPFGGTVGGLGIFAGMMMLGWMLLWTGADLFVLISALRMWRRRNRGQAIAAAILLAVTAVFGLLVKAEPLMLIWSLLNLAVGVWALVVLFRPETREAFERPSNPVPSVPPRPVTAGDARTQVREPAIGLMATAILNMLLTALIFLMFVASRMPGPLNGAVSITAPGGWSASYTQNQTLTVMPHGMPFLPGDYPIWPLLGAAFLFAFFVVIPSILTFLGAWKMRRLRGYGLAVTAAILAMLTPPLMPVGLIFGVWTLAVLMQRKVREAFGEGVG